MADFVANTELRYGDPEDENNVYLTRKRLAPGDDVPSGAFSKEDLQALKDSGAVVAKDDYLADEDRARPRYDSTSVKAALDTAISDSKEDSFSASGSTGPVAKQPSGAQAKAMKDMPKTETSTNLGSS